MNDSWDEEKVAKIEYIRKRAIKAMGEGVDSCLELTLEFIKEYKPERMELVCTTLDGLRDAFNTTGDTVEQSLVMIAKTLLICAYKGKLQVKKPEQKIPVE